MFLKQIIIGGVLFMIAGMASVCAAPAKKLSTTRVGQLEAEYRKATQIRKNQILQELTNGGFRHVAQQLMARNAPLHQQSIVTQQESPKPTLVSAVVQPAEQPHAQPDTQSVQNIQERSVEQAKLHEEQIKKYKTRLQQLDNMIGNSLPAAQSLQYFDDINKQIQELADVKAQLQTDIGNIQILRDLLAKYRQEFIQTQEKERNEFYQKVNRAVRDAQQAKNLDQVAKALEAIRAEKLRGSLSVLEQDDKSSYLAQLNEMESLLLKKQNELLQQQTEQQEKERAQQREEMVKEQAASDAVQKAAQEKQQQEQQEARTSFMQNMQSTMESANKADDLDTVLEQIKDVQEALGDVKNSEILPLQEKNQLSQKLEETLNTLHKKEAKLKKEQHGKAVKGAEKQRENLILPIGSTQPISQTITVPSLEDRNQNVDYVDVAITKDASGNITQVKYQGDLIEQLGSIEQRKNHLWIGAEIQVHKMMQNLSTRETKGGTALVPKAGVLKEALKLQEMLGFILSGLSQHPEPERHTYFNDYLKPALAEKIKRLQAQ